MEIHLPYGYSILTASLPDVYPVDTIEPPATAPAMDPAGAVQYALDHRLGELGWDNFAGARTAAIAVNDKTRPVPHGLLLPPLLARLNALGIPDRAITLFIATGTHPPMDPSEFESILPAEVLQRCRVISHDGEDGGQMIYLGETSRGTPVWSNREYVQAGLKIVVGNIEPHQFAGFSGGVKTAAIGLSSIETINRNHVLMTHPGSRLGEYEANPARQDIEEIGAKIGVRLALNAVLNQDRQIVYVLAGDPRAVMAAGVKYSRQVCQAAVRQTYRLVIASPGGYPKDINLYQAQKGLAHAALITQPGGTVILAAACPEGTGSPHYEAWMRDKHSYSEVIEHFRQEGFRIGPHKAYQIARDASQVRLLTCSGLDADRAQRLLLNPQPGLQQAIDLALNDLPPGERIAVLAHAASTIPYLVK